MMQYAMDNIKTKLALARCTQSQSVVQEICKAPRYQALADEGRLMLELHIHTYACLLHSWE